MIRIADDLLAQLTAAAEAAYPRECCGLLAGTGGPDGTVTVTRVVASANVADGDIHDSFEVDPKVRFDLMRDLGEIGDRPRGPARLVGHYHSHPDHPPLPSARDLAAAFEPDLVWIILGVEAGAVTAVSASRLDGEAGTSRQIPLRRPDGAPYPMAIEPAPEEPAP